MRKQINAPAFRPIHSWAIDERPREKLLQKGPEALSDAELLAILLGTGIRGRSALDLGRSILDKFGSFSKLGRASGRELMRLPGVGPAKAILLLAALELGRRKASCEHVRVKISSPQQAFQYIAPKIQDKATEHFYVLFLSRNMEILGEKLVSIGGMTQAIVDPKVIFREALDHQATCIICFHNHPSGELKPSQADIQVTNKLKAIAEMFDIQLVDHLIVGRGASYYSVMEGRVMGDFKGA